MQATNTGPSSALPTISSDDDDDDDDDDDETYNIRSEERTALLQQLQDLIGDVPLHFWAACQVCDVSQINILINLAKVSPEAVLLLSTSVHKIISTCKLDSVGLLSLY